MGAALAMEAAANLVAPDGLILTTDADTLVETDWVAANRREIAAGADAVAGYVMADPTELILLPARHPGARLAGMGVPAARRRDGRPGRSRSE